MSKIILIIDDFLPILNSLRGVLVLYHYRVYTAHDNTSLLKMTISPDVVLADYHMRRRESFCALKQFNNTHHKYIHIILMSGDPEIKTIANQLNVDDYIAKPIIVDDLLTKLEAF